MTALVIGQKEQQARLDFISKRLQELSQALDSVDRLQQFKEESLRAQARLENAEQDKDWVDAEIQQTESPATQPTTAP
jgi:Tfp pilus assembly protein PilN